MGQHPSPEWPTVRGSSLYVGDMAAVLRGLVRAEFEAAALRRHEMEPVIAEAVAELAGGISYVTDLAKWVQGWLWGIDWHERPTSKERTTPQMHDIDTLSDQALERLLGKLDVPWQHLHLELEWGSDNRGPLSAADWLADRINAMRLELATRRGESAEPLPVFLRGDHVVDANYDELDDPQWVLACLSCGGRVVSKHATEAEAKAARVWHISEMNAAS